MNALLSNSTLNRRESLKHLIERTSGPNTDQACHSHLKHETGTIGSRHLIMHLKQYLKSSHEDFRRRALRHLLQSLALITRDVDVALTARGEIY